jgi:hypothetical protein
MWFIMKNYLPILLLFVILLVLISFLPEMVHAQQSHGGIVPIGVGPGNNDGYTTPIGGIAIFAAVGGGYALKKLWDRKK